MLWRCGSNGPPRRPPPPGLVVVQAGDPARLAIWRGRAFYLAVPGVVSLADCLLCGFRRETGPLVGIAHNGPRPVVCGLAH